MIKSKKAKSILLTTSLSLGLSLMIPASAYAASYTTVSGDSLFKISRIFGTSIERLMTDNHLNSSYLDIGQVLDVPGSVYTVQKGDTLFLIAKKFGIPLAALQRANNIYSDYLDIGQVLIIPTVTAPDIQVSAESYSASEKYSASDVDLLARLIMAESQGEPYDAKVAVGAVVVNRVQSGQWADSISKVIYQKFNGYYQFTPVENGWIDKPANADCIKAAKEALSGQDPSNGAIFYYDNSTTNQWILAKQVATKIGTMTFTY